MKKKFLPLLLFATLTLAMCAANPGLALAEPDMVVVAHSKGALEADVQLAAMVGNFTNIEWRLVFEDLTATDLSGATMLIMSKSDSSMEYTDAELNAIKSWFDKGGKTLWVAADSDYGTDHQRQATANAVLEKVGSVLRIDDASTEDGVSNAGASYRVLGVSDYCDEEVRFLVDGVNRALFHGPGVVIAYVGGSYYTLDEVAIDGVYTVMATSDAGVIVDNNEPVPNALTAGDEGNFPLMAIQVYEDEGSMVIATGDAPFDQYVGLYKPEIRRYDRYGPEANSQEGGKLFENIVNYVIRTKLNTEIAALEGTVSDLTSDISGLTSQVASLEGDLSDLEDEKSTLEDAVASLESDVSGLEASVSSLEGDLASAKSSASTMQIAAVAALIVGLVVGVFVGPMIRKS